MILKVFPNKAYLFGMFQKGSTVFNTYLANGSPFELLELLGIPYLVYRENKVQTFYFTVHWLSELMLLFFWGVIEDAKFYPWV